MILTKKLEREILSLNQKIEFYTRKSERVLNTNLKCFYIRKVEKMIKTYNLIINDLEEDDTDE